MENHYQIKGNTIIMDVPYKDKVVAIYFDKEDLALATSIPGSWLVSYKDSDKTYFYIFANHDRKCLLHKLIMNASSEDHVYFKDKDNTNLRKSNLSLNTYEMDESWRESKRQGYHNMNKEKRLNILQGIKENRYSKEWSDQLSSTKKGRSNPSTLLNPEKVRAIREEYADERTAQQALGEKYNVGRTTIADIVNYRTWNEIGEDKSKEYRVYEENHIFPLNLTETPVQEFQFTNIDIPLMDFVIELHSNQNTEFIFFQKIGDIKLYVEVRDRDKKFIHSFEVVFPEYLTEQHIHNYVISQRKPVRYMNRHAIHKYMQILSTFLFGESYETEQSTRHS